MDLDSGIADRTDGKGQGQSLEQRKIHVNVEALHLETGEAIGDALELLAHGVEMIEPFLQAKVAQVVGAEFIAQETEELLVLFQEGILPVSPEGVVAMFDLIDHGGEFSAQPF